jgi:hypothetical protein
MKAKKMFCWRLLPRRSSSARVPVVARPAIKSDFAILLVIHSSFFSLEKGGRGVAWCCALRVAAAAAASLASTRRRKNQNDADT